MPLRERHGAGVKPAVDNLRYTVHFSAAFFAFDGYGINVRTMQLDFVRAIVRQGFKLFDGADGVLMSAGAFPYVKRCAPVTVAADAPVLYVFQPVSEAALSDCRRNPVYCIVICNKLVADSRHADEPGLTCVVDERCITAPAVWIAVLEYRCLEELAGNFEILDDERVCVLYEYSRPIRILSHFALAVYELYESNIVLVADTGIVFTECRCRMNDTCTVGCCDVIIAHYEECFFIDFADSIRIKRLVLAVLQFFTLHACQYLALTLYSVEYCIDQRFRQVVNCAVNTELYIVNICIYAECKVRRQRPRCRRPCKEVCVFVLDLEFDHCGTLFYVLVALGNLVRGKRRTAAWAVRNNLMSFVKESLVPDFLERPPLGFNEVIFVGDVRMLHVSPEAYNVGKFFPHALVLPNGLTAFFDERLNAVFFNLLLAIDAESLFDLKLNRKAVCIPACLTENLFALHGLIARQHILDNTCKNVSDMRFAVCRRRAVIEGKCVAALALVDCLLCNVLFFPEIENVFFTLNEIQIGVNFFVQHTFPSKSKNARIQNRMRAFCCHL